MGFSVGAPVVSLFFPANRSYAENPDNVSDFGLVDVDRGDIGEGRGGAGPFIGGAGGGAGTDKGLQLEVVSLQLEVELV